MITAHSKDKQEIIIFSVIALLLSTLICCISYLLNNPHISLLVVLSPAILALVFTAVTQGKKGVYDLFVKQTTKKIALKWLLISLFGIPFVGSLAMLTSLDFDFSKFHLRTTELLPQGAIILLIAIGEEYGWRGFLLPRLLRIFNVFHSSILLGAIWGLWHLPAYLIGTGVPLKMSFIIFLLWVIIGTLFMSWIYYYTQSVLTALLVHISANAAFNYLLILPEFTGSMYAFGLVVLYLSILVLAVYLFGRKDLLKGYKSFPQSVTTRN